MAGETAGAVQIRSVRSSGAANEGGGKIDGRRVVSRCRGERKKKEQELAKSKKQESRFS